MVTAPVSNEVDNAFYGLHMSSLLVKVILVGLNIYLSSWFDGGRFAVRKVIVASPVA